MASLLATDAYIDTPSSRTWYLAADRNGYPVDKQVPRTHQNYTGTGGTIDYDGSIEVNIDGDTLVSPLVIRLANGSVQRLRNLIGRVCTVNIRPGNLQTVSIVASPGLLSVNGTSLLQGTHIIPADGTAKSITLFFNSVSIVSMDYGASSTSVVASNLPEVSSQQVTYAYGRPALLSTPSVYIPNGDTYDVTWSPLNPNSEGEIVAGTETLTVTGPGMVNVAALYSPASGRTEPTNVYATLSKGGNYYGSFTIQATPILSNVYDFPFYSASNTNGTLKMLNLDSADTSRLAVNTEGSIIDVDNLGNTIRGIAISVRDSLIFFTTGNQPAVVWCFSLIQSTLRLFVSMTTYTANFWSGGADIADIEYDEKNSCLYVMSNVNNRALTRIGIKPMDEIHRSNQAVETVSFTPRLLNVAGAVLMNSIAVCPKTSSLYIAHSRAANGLGIAVYSNFDSMTQLYLYTSPVISPLRMSIGFTGMGDLLIHYQSDLSVYYVDNTRPLDATAGDVVLAHTLPSFSWSLSRTCYGWTQS